MCWSPTLPDIKTSTQSDEIQDAITEWLTNRGEVVFPQNKQIIKSVDFLTKGSRVTTTDNASFDVIPHKQEDSVFLIECNVSVVPVVPVVRVVQV